MIKGTIEGLDIVISGLTETSLDVQQAAYQGVLLALNAAFKACETMLSPQDHTLKELALLGHPYSASQGFSIHDPDELVHIQTGAYRDALEKVSPSGAGDAIIEGQIKIDDSMADLDRMIQEGTIHMRGREWMKYIVQHYGDDFANVIEASVTAALQKHAA